jgi:hypothetical protein
MDTKNKLKGIRAEDLIKQQKEREERKKITYEKIYEMVEKKINVASSADYYHTWYQIPEFLLGLPLYSMKECKKYIKEKLKNNGFKTEFYDPNILYIDWSPKKDKK